MTSLQQHPMPDKPLPLDPPDPVEPLHVRKAVAYGQVVRAANGYCPLCLTRLDAEGACPDELCLCFWWGRMAPGTISDPRR